MKKLLSIVLLALLLVLPTTLASADYEAHYVFDGSGVLSEDDLKEIDQRFADLDENYATAVTIIVDNYENDEYFNFNDTDNFDEYTQTLYDQIGIDGYLLVLSLEHYDYRLYTSVETLDEFSEYNILASTFDALDEENYKDAVISFADGLQQHFDDPEGISGGDVEYVEGNDYETYFYDFSGVVTDEEAERLDAKLSRIESKLGIPARIVVLEDFTDPEWNPEGIRDIIPFAKYLYDDAMFTGVMLVISTGDRDWAIHAGDDVDTTLNQKVVDYMGKEVSKFLKKDDYYGGFNRFAELASETLTAHTSGVEYVVPRNQLAWWWLPLAIVIGALISLGIMTALTAPLRTVSMKAGASSYLVNNSLNYHDSRDIFLYRNVVRTRREKSDSSSSSSGSGGTTSGGKY